ncbi:MAG: barstar family protein [Saprospiraceae bacterium]
MLKPFIININLNNRLPDQYTENCFVATLTGAKCRTENELHDSMAASLNFPDYYGRNLDALFDNLLDLSWISQDCIILYIRQFDLIMVDQPEKKYFKEAIILLLNDWCGSITDELAEGSGVEKKCYIIIDHCEGLEDMFKELEVPFDYITKTNKI